MFELWGINDSNIPTSEAIEHSNNFMKLILIIKNRDSLDIQLKRGAKVIGHEYLTISQGFDKLLIRVLDILLSRNKIDKLSLKSLEIRGKLMEKAVSGMVLKTIKAGLAS